MDRPITFGSLFAGIGGIDLGFERSGMQCKWQCEIDDYANRVLEKHWPNVRRWRDVRTFPPEPAEEWRVDVIAGGFPCVDISNAGKRAGIEAERSGLWFEYERIIRILRPEFVAIENVAALLERGIERVLGNLAALGFDAEWHCVPAAAVGAPHIRDRVFILAYPNGTRLEGHGRPREARQICTQETLGVFRSTTGDEQWVIEPNVDRMAHGIPNRSHRLRCLGNAVVPQVSQWIGERIVEAMKDRHEQ